MSGIAGIVSFDGRPIDREAFARMMRALAPRGPDGQHSVIGEDFALGNAIFHTTPESSLEQQPLRFEHYIITADARIDNRAELLDELEIPRPEQSKLSDAGVIVRAYAKWKRGAPYKLEGNFAFAIWDTREKRLFCARDVFGAKPFCFTKLPWGFVFASDTMAMRASQLFNLTINEGRFADALTPIYVESLHVHETLWNEIQRLRHQHWLEAHDNRITKQVYFRFAETHVDLPKSDDDKIALFHDEFVRSVDRCLRTVGPVGLTLTGGLDSGSIACVARRLLKERGQGPLRAYSALLGGPECTETPGVNAIVEGGHIDLNVIGPNDAEEMGNVFLRFMEQTDTGGMLAFLTHVPMGTYARAAAAGTRVVMDGRDGAALFGGHGNPMFLALDAGRLGMFARLATENYDGSHWPLPVKLARERTASTLSHWLQQRALAPVSPTLFRQLRAARDRANATRWLNASLCSEALIERAYLRERYAEATAAIALTPANSKAFVSSLFDLRPTVRSNENFDRMANAFGVEARSPMFDRRLVQLAVHSPWELSATEASRKPLQRRMLSSELPERVVQTPAQVGVHWPLRRTLLRPGPFRAWLERSWPRLSGRREWLASEAAETAIRAVRAHNNPSTDDLGAAIRAAGALEWLDRHAT